MIVKELKALLAALAPENDNLEVVIPVYNLASGFDDLQDINQEESGVHEYYSGEKYFCLVPKPAEE